MDGGSVSRGSSSSSSNRPPRLHLSDTELRILGPSIAGLIVLILVSLFFAQHNLTGVARSWDLDRVERYIRLCRDKLEAEARAVPSEESLRDLQNIGLFIDVFPPETEIPQPNPRYVPRLHSVEAWDVVRGPDGQPVSVIRIGRYDSTARLTMRAVRYYTIAGAIGGALLILTTWLLLRRAVFRQILRLTEEVATNSLNTPAAIPATEPLDALRATIHKAIGTRDDEAALRQRLLDGHHESACISKTDGTLQEVNAAYCRMFDKTRDELVGTNYLDLIPPSDRGDALNSLRRLSRRHPMHIVEHRVVLPDGTTRWMRWRDQAVFDETDQVIEVLSFGTDISAEKTLETRLTGLRLAFNQMQSLARTGSLTWDILADRMDWTEETFRLLGRERDETLPSLTALLDTVVPEDRGPLHRLFERARENGDPFEYEFRAVLPDGSRRVLQSRAEVRADPKTKLLGQLTCTLRDITALRDAEAATRRELRFREAIEQSLAAGIVASDESGRVLRVNPAFCAMTGWSAEELAAAKPPYPYWPEEEIPAISRAFELATTGQTPPEGFELKFCRKDGTRFDVLVKVAPLLDSDDKQLGWLGAITDITAIQQTRRELRAAEDAARSELLYRQAIDASITVGLVTIDLAGRPIAMNEAYGRMFGYTEQEVMAMGPPYPLWPEMERAKIEKAFALHLAGKTPPEGFNLRFKHKDGHLLDVLVTAAPVYDAQHRQIGILSALTDITALQESKRRLRATNERLQIAQDVAEFGIWDWDPVKDTLHWDRQSFAIFGHPAATNAEEVWRKVHSVEERERLTYELERLIVTGATSGQDRIRTRWPDGTLHDILSTYVILRDAAGRATRVVGINRDVTSELEEERELRDANERLAAALEGGQFGTFEHIIGVGDVNWSPANYEINGIDPSITDPAELFEVWKKCTGPFFPELMARMNALPVSENHLTYEFTARPPGREPRRVRTSVFIERSKQGHPIRLVGITRRID